MVRTRYGNHIPYRTQKCPKDLVKYIPDAFCPLLSFLQSYCIVFFFLSTSFSFPSFDGFQPTLICFPAIRLVGSNVVSECHDEALSAHVREAFSGCSFKITPCFRIKHPVHENFIEKTCLIYTFLVYLQKNIY